jgi:hypothetical protein
VRAAPNNTLSLFEVETLEAPPEPLRKRMQGVEWSYSRRSTLEQCPRKYYFDYYGSALHRAASDPQKARLRGLKKLQNRHERAGEIVHQVIADYFRKAQQGDVLNAGSLQFTPCDLAADSLFGSPCSGVGL